MSVERGEIFKTRLRWLTPPNPHLNLREEAHRNIYFELYCVQLRKFEVQILNNSI